MNAWGATRAGLRFHAAAGVRVALRNAWMGIVVALFCVTVLTPNPLGTVIALALGLAAAGKAPWALFAMAALAVPSARAAVPQVRAGGNGWMRSLPMGAAGRRGALVLALILAQAPVMGVALGSVLAVALAPGLRVSVPKLLAIPTIAVAAALLALPWPTRPVRWRGRGLLPLRVAGRALSWRVLPCILPSAIPLAGAWFFRANNELSAAEATNAVRLCGVVAVTLALAGLADTLHSRRAPWAWARSLPSSSAQRVWHDVIVLVAGTSPVLLTVAAFDLRATLTIVVVLPALALVAAAAIRRAGARRTAAAGEVLLHGVIATTALTLSGWAALAIAAATPLALGLAVRREQRLSPSRWQERHHRVEGDSAFMGAA